MSSAKIAVALPVLSEFDNMATLMQLLRSQTCRDFELYVCVNQSDSWWSDGNEKHLAACRDNRRTLEFLCSQGSAEAGCPVHVVDRSSAGQGWDARHCGVGWARKVLFDLVVQQSPDDTIVVSLDADTSFSPTYFASLQQFFATGTAQSLCVPYYHRVLSSSPDNARAMLRYEIYMRHYLINLLRIGSPYAFSALGSAMAFTATAYRRSGGISPLQAGEDFYLMQRMVKTGSAPALWLDSAHCLSPRSEKKGLRGTAFSDCVEKGPPQASSEIVYPQPRASWRVPFGTGPAVARGVEAIEQQYPLYSAESFALVGDTYALFPALYERDIETPMTAFLQQQLRRDDLWTPLRRNFKRRDLFVHACTELVDGLRILQFLRHRHAEHHAKTAPNPYAIDFCHAPLADIETLRNQLFRQEMQLRSRPFIPNRSMGLCQSGVSFE